MTRCTTPLSINPALLSLFVTLDADSDPSLMVARGRIQGFQIVSGSMVSVGLGTRSSPHLELHCIHSASTFLEHYLLWTLGCLGSTFKWLAAPGSTATVAWRS
ncbi:hypothetical protein BD779DRAFT_1536910, partial [Infundibulicybe gibba]